VVLMYEVRAEMQRAMRKANIRDVFVRHNNGVIRVTALIDSRSIARFEYAGMNSDLAGETTNWEAEHFMVSRGEVLLSERAG
jgi:hypothetical protein